MQNKTKLRLLRVAKAVTIIILVIIITFPIYWMVVTALTERNAILNNDSVFLNIENTTLSNFQTIIESKPLLTWFSNSTVVTISSAFIAVIVSILAGYCISRYRYKGVNVMSFSLLLIRMLPETLLVVPLYIMFAKAGLINRHLALVISNITFAVPFSVWMLKGYFDGIPTSLEEAARIDGCNRFQALWKVVVPLALPGIAATSIYCCIICWSEFMFARLFIKQATKWTITVGVASLVGEYTIIWGEIMAAAAITAIPIALVFIVVQKYMVSGMTSGAVKG